jgi:hypothetical protein
MVADSSPPTAPKRSKRWRRFSLAGLLFAVFCWAGLWAGVHLGSKRLSLQPDPFQLRIAQRTVQEIPGLRGRVRVQIGDITAGQTLLTVTDDANQPLIAPSSVQENDLLSFSVDGNTFYLFVGRLENKLIGNDYGMLELSSEDRWSKNPLVNVRTGGSNSAP